MPPVIGSRTDRSDFLDDLLARSLRSGAPARGSVPEPARTAPRSCRPSNAHQYLKHPHPSVLHADLLKGNQFSVADSVKRYVK